MAADSDGSDDSLTTVVTCEGDLHDPEFPAKFELILDKLRTLLCRGGGDNFAADQLYVRKLEPWNSVRVTLAIPRDAALRLRQLASEGSQQLRALGILSVQVEGDQVISLRIAGRFGQEPQEIVLRTGSQDVAGPSSQQSASEGIAIVSGLTRMLSASSQSLPGPSAPPSTSVVVPAAATTITTPLSTSSASASATADKVQFRSPNVVCPTDTQVPKVPAVVQTAGCTTAGGTVQRNYNGPFPFASMTHAAQAIHSRETQSQQQQQQLTPPPVATAASTSHPFTQPPPPYPSQPPPQPTASTTVGLVKTTINPNSPNVAKSSPLLVNLLQNDGAQVQKIIPSVASDQQRTTLIKPLVDTSSVNVVTSAKTIDQTQAVITNDMMDTTNNSFTSPAVTPPVPVPPQQQQQQQTAIKYPPPQSHINSAIYNTSITQKSSSSVVPTPQSNSSLLPTNSNNLNVVPVSVVGGGVRATMAPRMPPHQFLQQQQQQLQQQKLTTQVPVRPVVQPSNTAVGLPSQIVNQLRPVRPQQLQQQQQQITSATRLPQPVQFTPQQFPRQNFRGQLGQFVQQQQTFQQNFQQFPSPPPYPRQRLEAAVRTPAFQDINRFQQQQQQPQPQLQQRIQQQPQTPTGWQQQQFQQIDSSNVVTPVGVGQQMPTLTGLTQMNNPNIQQQQQHLASLNAVLDSTLSSITPSLTDLSKSDLDSLLPSLEGELDSTPDIPDIPESLTSTGKKRQFLINPLTGVLEPMPSDTSGSESDADDAKEPNDIFHDFNSPLNDRSNSIYSDEDTCSTTISRKFDTTDQSDSEATVKSTNSDNSVKSHQRSKSNKNRDRNRDSPGLKKNSKDLPTEKIKLRLKLEKSEPVSPAYKVDISFINTQQPKRATQNVTSRGGTVPAAGSSPSVPCSTTTTTATTPQQAGEELRVPPLHISLRGRNSVVINSEKKKKYTKLNPDGSIAEVKKSKKTVDGMKVKKSLSAKDLTVKSGGSLLPSALSKSESSLTSSSGANNNGNTKTSSLMKSSELMLPSTSTSTSTSTLEQKLSNAADVKITSDILKSDNNKSIKSLKTNSDLDDLPLKVRMREPGEVLSSSSSKSSKQPLTGDVKKSKKSSKFNHVEGYREQNLLTGGHLVDDCKSHKKLKNDDKYQQQQQQQHKLNSHFKKDKFKDKSLKERTLPGHVGEIRRGSESDVAKCLKRHADSNGLSHTEKKRRLSQSEGKSNATTITESQGVNKSVKLKTSSASDEHITAAFSQSVQQVVGSTNVGTISTMANKSLLKTSSSSSSGKLQKSVTKVKRDKMSLFSKSKDNNTSNTSSSSSGTTTGNSSSSFKSKDLNREKTYSQNVAEKLAKHLTLPTGEIDMEAKFKQSLLETSNELPRRHSNSSSTPQQLDSKKVGDNSNSGAVPSKNATADVLQLDNLVQNQISDQKVATPDRQEPPPDDTTGTKVTNSRKSATEQQPATTTVKQENSPDRKSTDTDLPQSQRLDDKQSGRSPNSGGQGEDSGIESMDALSEKSPNQASQSPHSHTDITIADPTTVTIKTIKSEVKRENNCLPDLMDIEEQLAKMDGLPTLNGDLSHMIKTEPFMKTETLIEKLEGTESSGGKDLNENKEHHVKEAILDECCGPVNDLKVQNTPDVVTTDCKVELSELPLTVAMQESLKQGNISVTSRSTIEHKTTDKDSKMQPDLEICLVNNRKFNCSSEQKSTEEECNNKKSVDNNSLKNEQQQQIIKAETKELDFDPLPIRRKPPLYTYSNPEKQTSRETDSPLPNLSDLESENSDSNSECSELKSKISQKAATITRRRKQNLDNIQINDAELDGCIEPIDGGGGGGHYLNDLTGFKKNDIVVKKTPKSLLEQLLIEIPSELPAQQISSTSPSVSEKSLNTSKSSIRTRSSSKLNSPDISESSKSEKSIKTPRHSPGILGKDSPANSPVLCKASPKSVKASSLSGTLPIKRKRQESESSTQSNASLDEQGNMTRNKKARKCSENAAELIKACMGFDHNVAADNTTTIATAATTINKNINTTKTIAALKDSSSKKVSDKNNKLSSGLLRKSQLAAADVESSDSDEPLIEVAGKVRNKHVATRNKLNSTKSNIPTPVKSVPVIGKVSNANANANANAHATANANVNTEEKAVCTRRSVRNNAAAAGATPAALNTVSSPIVTLKTRSKLQHQLTTDKTVTNTTGATTAAAVTETDANRRKTRSAVSDDVKRRRNSRDGK